MSARPESPSDHAADVLRAYLDRRNDSLKIGKDVVHSFDGGNFALCVSDIVLVLDALDAANTARVLAEEDADRLALHLGKLSDELYEERYTLKGPCRGCYDALAAHAAVAASRTKETNQ